MTGMLEHLMVVELGGPATEWCGRLFSQARSRVVLVEPSGGSESRRFGPFYRGDVSPETSLRFWHYNTDKESVVLDLATEAGREGLLRLIERADILLEAEGEQRLAALGLSAGTLQAHNPRLVHIAITDFGPEGPWAGYRATDIVHLALGGQMIICGYDDIANTPPLAPAGNQAYHMAASWAFVGALARLQTVDRDGGGVVQISIHDACAGMTENAFPNYDYTGLLTTRRTGRHASVRPTPPWQHRAADGRYINAQLVNVPPPAWRGLIEWMDSLGMADDLTDPIYYVPETFQEQAQHISEVLGRFIASMTADEFFLGGQARGLIVCDINTPKDLLTDEHLAARDFWVDVERIDGQPGTYRFAGSAFLCADGETGPIRSAPMLDQRGPTVRAALGG